MYINYIIYSFSLRKIIIILVLYLEKYWNYNF